jgi:hypothetical protein
LGRGNWAAIARSQSLSLTKRRCAIASFADGVTLYLDRGRRAVIAFSIVLATVSGPPPRRRMGPL